MPEEGACAPSFNASPELLALCRDASLFPLVRELLCDGVARLRLPGPRYFEYELVFREEAVASDEDLSRVYAALGAAIGRPTLQAKPKILPGLEGQETLVLPAEEKRVLLRMFLELAGELATLAPVNTGASLEADRSPR